MPGATDPITRDVIPRIRVTSSFPRTSDSLALIVRNAFLRYLTCLPWRLTRYRSRGDRTLRVRLRSLRSLAASSGLPPTFHLGTSPQWLTRW